MAGVHGNYCAQEVSQTDDKVGDCNNDMLEIVDKQALSNVTMTAKMVWQAVKADLDKRSKSWIGMTDLEVLNRVTHIRCQTHGRDMFRT